ncbi:MAG: TetR/AcrR family transcriptional regulator [Gammaproteobacteria bacterium]|nr:TetR/AcrR family transcriptional regulator [Gammaproteobacteria bacterium]
MQKPATDGHARRHAAKRDFILNAATELFLREGYGRLTMDRVLAEVGGSKRTLYRHFKKKDELFAAIVAKVSDRVLAALEPAPGRGDIRETLVTMGIKYLNVLLSPEGLALYRAMVSEAPHFPELSKSFFANGPGRASRHLAKFIRDQAAAGRLQVDDPQLVASQFLGAVRGDVHLAAVLAARKPTKAAIKQAVEQAVEAFLGGG